MNTKSLYIVYLLLIISVSAELILRAFGYHRTWSEGIGRGYASGYQQNHNTWFVARNPNSEFVVNNGDFEFLYKTNSLGIRERDSLYTDSGAVRVLCLGDSYTEGLGTTYENSYPKVLERELNKRSHKVQVYNAGIASSDPFYAFILYKHKLQQAKPKYVLITFNSSDISDYIFRGGMERFKDDGKVEGKKPPWYEPIYEYSYLARFIINTILRKTMQNLFLTRGEYREVFCPKAISATTEILDSLNKLVIMQGGELLVLLQPIAKELAISKEYNQFTRSTLKNLEDSVAIRNIKTINMCDALDGKITLKNIDSLSYKNDLHFTQAGYELFAIELLQAIDKKYPSYFK